jgi:ferrochelatase
VTPGVDVDAVLVVSFGGPEGPADVEPFLDNVLRGRPISPERRRQVAAHYLELGGVSPINGVNRTLVEALAVALKDRGSALPVYWGNRNWHPYLADTMRSMRADGVRHAAAFVASAYSSYSSCRQYRDNLDAARRAVGNAAPRVTKLRPFFNHPGFVEPLADGLHAGLAEAGTDRVAPVLMTAHSIPVAQAATCAYERQLHETARLVAERAGVTEWQLVYQSRSGPPTQPWLAPDVNQVIDEAVADGGRALVATPIGFASDHMEVVYDLDRVAAASAARRGLRLVRTPTPGTDTRFVEMICDLVDELREPATTPRVALGDLGPIPCPCAPGCCPPPPTPPGVTRRR